MNMTKIKNRTNSGKFALRRKPKISITQLEISKRNMPAQMPYPSFDENSSIHNPSSQVYRALRSPAPYSTV